MKSGKKPILRFEEVAACASLPCFAATRSASSQPRRRRSREAMRMQLPPQTGESASFRTSFYTFPRPQGGETDRYLLQASPTLPDEARAGNVQARRPLLRRRTSSPRRAYIGPGGKGGRWGKPE